MTLNSIKACQQPPDNIKLLPADIPRKVERRTRKKMFRVTTGSNPRLAK